MSHTPWDEKSIIRAGNAVFETLKQRKWNLLRIFFRHEIVGMFVPGANSDQIAKDAKKLLHNLHLRSRNVSPLKKWVLQDLVGLQSQNYFDVKDPPALKGFLKDTWYKMRTE